MTALSRVRAALAAGERPSDDDVRAVCADAERLCAMAREWDRNRRNVRYEGMPIWDALCDAIGSDADGDGMRAAIDAAIREPK